MAALWTVISSKTKRFKDYVQFSVLWRGGEIFDEIPPTSSHNPVHFRCCITVPLFHLLSLFISSHPWLCAILSSWPPFLLSPPPSLCVSQLYGSWGKRMQSCLLAPLLQTIWKSRGLCSWLNPSKLAITVSVHTRMVGLQDVAVACVQLC